MQIELDDESKHFLVINTHKGLYRFNRLPYGVASAPAIFQKVMDQVLQGLPGVVCYIDDILVTGRTDMEHMRNLEAVFKRLKEYGFRLKLRKCQFFQESVEYLGKIISSEGLHPSPKKVEAILKVSPPTDVSELRSFLGMVNHYGRFIKCLADLSAPLNRLLRKDEPWSWNTECRDSFIKIKEALTTTKVLAHFSPDLPLGLACDASAVGIGAVLFHRYPDGAERPIAYASKSLTSAEKNYSQIEREALSIIFGIKKFHQFLYGRSFILITDHKPLLTIFGPKKGIPVMSASRLQRWAIILSAYSYSIEYKPTKQHGNADCLSRLPLDTDPAFERYQSLHPVVNLIQQNQITQLPVSAHEVKNATAEDPVLKQVLAKIKAGWPKIQTNLPSELQPYFNRSFQLTVQEGCILCGLKVVIPSSLRERVLEEIHEGHTGIVKMKSMARIHVWWPKIDVDIERTVGKCTACQENSRDPVRAPLHPWEQPKQPWMRIHVDFAGPFEGSMWFIVVDAHTKWPEVIPMKTTTANNTITVLRSLFARYGIPNQIVSDNGSQFTSEEYRKFCESNGIRRTLVAPYHPSSNGEAERFVQTFKSALRRAKSEDLKQALAQFLLHYRTSSHGTTGKSPAEMMFGRRIQTRLDLLHPKPKRTKSKNLEKEQVPRLKLREFQVGNCVWMRNYQGKPRWLPGVVTARTGPVSYRIQCRGQEHRRHVDQLKRRESVGPSKQVELGTEEFSLYPEVVMEQPREYIEQNEHLPEPEREPDQPEAPRYSLRKTRNPPIRYGQ